MTCVFCDKKSIEGTILTETNNFMVIIGRGQIVEGYSLIAPKKHFLCYGMLPKKLMEEYLELKQKLDAALRAEYPVEPMYFEHGIVGQCIPHAHMHCAPSNKDLLPRLTHYYHVYRELTSEMELKGVVRDFGAYYFYQSGGRKFAFDVNPNEMAMRHALADELGIPEAADWRAVNKEGDDKDIAKSVAKLEKHF